MRRPRRLTLNLERLDDRTLLSASPLELDTELVRPMEIRAERPNPALEARLARMAELREARIARTLAPLESKPKKKVFKATSVVIYGTILPAPNVTNGKERGAAAVAGGVVWLLDLSAVKGFDNYVQQLLQKPSAIFGTIEMTQQSDGSVKRKIKVGWMEPLNNVPIARPGVEITPFMGRPRINKP